jgi:ceramide glucosyltransferase
LIECRDLIGANAKISKLARLVRLAQNEICIVSDEDVAAPPDLLSNLIRSLANDEVGLAHCFYRLANPMNLAMGWETICINADFWSQVLQGQTMGIRDFALGAVMAIKRQALQRIGGFEAVVDYLADDFQLGHRIARSGQRIETCPVVAECREPEMNWKAVWFRQLRWQRTIRVCKPWPYAMSLLANPLLWPLLSVVVAPVSIGVPLLVFALIIRITISHDLLRRFSPRNRDWKWCWLAPFKDACSVLLWIAAWSGNEVRWRGATYCLQQDGRLVCRSTEFQPVGTLTLEKRP